MNRVVMLIAVLGLASCAGKAKTGPVIREAATPDMSDWKQMVKITDQPIFSKAHKRHWVDIYVGSSASDQYRAAQGPYPVGARIVKVHYTDESASQIQMLAVMRKMEPGYDSENGDWYYAKFNKSGTKAKMQGKIAKCINCHGQASDRDYVFGLPN